MQPPASGEPGGGPPDGRYLRTFSLREDLSGETFTDLIKVVTIELPKVPAEADGHRARARFFVCREEEEFTMLAEGHPGANSRRHRYFPRDIESL
ncbi:MAG: hypothetical protein LBQ35_03795 [Spirochaetaceae bacterium]|nr:hypothetical protein [Spirochaetaceae bacterium]